MPAQNRVKEVGPCPRRPELNRVATAFTLIELLVVILIMTIVMAILLPAIAGARTSARKAATQTLMRDLQTSCGQFTLDKPNTTPGYFTPREMGSSDNGTPSGGSSGRGFSAMKNLLLDLSGGITNGTGGGTIVTGVGPLNQASRQVNVDTALIGAPTSASNSGKAYFKPDNAYLATQEKPGQTATSVAAHLQIPDVIDAFGNPILAWVEDERSPSRTATNGDPYAPFAQVNSNSETAKFYWASNAAYLNASGLGRSGRSQLSSSGTTYSLMGGNLSDAALKSSLAAALGHPAFPLPNIVPPSPGQARGKIIFHSAGADGWYMGSEDRGGKLARAAGGANATPTFTPAIDAMGDFDDIVVGAGN